MAGDAPLPRNDRAWIGALLVNEAIGHLRFIHRTLEATAKASQKRNKK